LNHRQKVGGKHGCRVIEQLIAALNLKTAGLDGAAGGLQRGNGRCVAFQRAGRAGELLNRGVGGGKTQDAMGTCRLPAQ